MDALTSVTYMHAFQSAILIGQAHNYILYVFILILDLPRVVRLHFSCALANT